MRHLRQPPAAAAEGDLVQRPRHLVQVAADVVERGGVSRQQFPLDRQPPLRARPGVAKAARPAISAGSQPGSARPALKLGKLVGAVPRPLDMRALALRFLLLAGRKRYTRKVD